MSPSPIRAVLFDYGLVLSGPPHPAAWQRMKDLLQVDEPAFHAAYWRRRHDYDRGALNSESYWAAVAGELHRELTPALGAALTAADVDLWTQPNQAMIDWAASLQAGGIKTGILSNIGDAMEDGIMARFPWLLNFDHRTFSHRVGLAKPEIAIYRHAAEGLGVSAEEILFIDDRAEIIAAAREAGMQAIHYPDHTSFTQSMVEAGWASFLLPVASAP